MLNITRWLESLTTALERLAERDPEKIVKALEHCKEFGLTPIDQVILIFQAVFLIHYTHAKEERVKIEGIIPALFTLSEAWAKDQLEYMEERNYEDGMTDALDEALNILKQRNNGTSNSESDGISPPNGEDPVD